MMSHFAMIDLCARCRAKVTDENIPAERQLEMVWMFPDHFWIYESSLCDRCLMALNTEFCMCATCTTIDPNF